MTKNPSKFDVSTQIRTAIFTQYPFTYNFWYYMNFDEGQKEPADIIYTSGFILYCFILKLLDFDRFVTIYDRSLIFFLIFFM